MHSCCFLYFFGVFTIRHPFELEISDLLDIEIDKIEKIADAEATEVTGGASFPPATTNFFGEEGGGPVSIPEKEGGDEPTTLAVGEEGGGLTTEALGEEGGGGGLLLNNSLSIISTHNSIFEG